MIRRINPPDTEVTNLGTWDKATLQANKACIVWIDDKYADRYGMPTEGVNVIVIRFSQYKPEYDTKEFMDKREKDMEEAIKKFRDKYKGNRAPND